MSVPTNGRVAIIDDKPEQALPIMNELSKRRCPYTYYTGDLKNLPEEGDNNDIRVLFLDIYLSGDESRSDKEVKSTLVPVLQRMISKSNFPYILIYWSRHEDEHKALVEEIFEEDLKDRKPIRSLSLNKSDFFTLTSEPTPEFDAKVAELWDNILDLLNEVSVYNYLLKWENIVHSSTDKTVEDVFNNVGDEDDWEISANDLFKLLGVGFAGKQYFANDATQQNKNSFYTLNKILQDTLEHSIEEVDGINIEIEGDGNSLDTDLTNKINSKLLTQPEPNTRNYPGTVLECSDTEFGEGYKANVFHHVANYRKIENKIEKENQGSSKNQINKKCSNFRKKMREGWKKIWLVVTPLCDHAQKKLEYSKIVQGILIKEKYRGFLDHKSEAVFISPPFRYDEQNYVMVLQLRNFLSFNQIPEDENLEIIFRIRQSLLAEVQSKLARHISRQGVLFLDYR